MNVCAQIEVHTPVFQPGTLDSIELQVCEDVVYVATRMDLRTMFSIS